ncbi:hypothetical protein ABGV49_10890 [Chromobacterium vaccinii]|uniref:Glycosyltransferase 2-like prokaryotic type domain-containing protein n=1 Tax=Chromobacterium vaccinii TaxID=1108595 RepID=A0ABV0FBV2_9NEIS
MLTIITPIYLDPKKEYSTDRFGYFLDNAYCDNSIERIIVDHGSPKAVLDKFRKKISQKKIKLIELKKYGHPFSIGACRNAGARDAHHNYITFQDIDLFAPQHVYLRIIERIKKSVYFNELEIIPCLYLKKEASEEYISTNFNETHHNIFQKYLKGDKEKIQFFAPSTSMIITRTEYYLALGGNRADFFGHGYEDFEAINRLACLSNKFIRPHEYYNHEFQYSSDEYKGYRNFFAMFGRPLMQEGIFFVHLWHPTGDNKAYESRNKSNKKIFEHYLRSFDQKNELAPPISKARSQDKTLILAPHAGKTVGSIRFAIPFLGECGFIDEKNIIDEEYFLIYLKENLYTRVLFFNQYGNEKRLKLYAACTENGIKTLSFDRGALPDSWFFDPYGFNASSSSYAAENWEKEYPKEVIEDTEKYIHNLLNTETTLEKNGNRIGENNIRLKYNIGSKKVIFIPLQRPNDSVIKYFSDKTGSIQNFCAEIDTLASQLPTDWVIAVKNHPLEQDMPKMTNVIILHPDTHFYDALAMANATILINSGVGIYSLLFGKPTFCTGKSFYTQPGLAEKIDSPLNFLEKIRDLKSPNHQTVLKFISYLKNEFYSFGETEYLEAKNGSSITTSASKINFYQIILDRKKEELIFRKSIEFNKNSPLFDIYKTVNEVVQDDGVKKPQNPKESFTETPTPLQIKKPTPNIKGRLVAIQAEESDTVKIKRKVKKFFRSPRAFINDAIKKKLN